MPLDPELHRWARHPAAVACKALSDSRFVRCSQALLAESGCGDGGAQIRFTSDQDPGEAPIDGAEIILFDEEYTVPLAELFSALLLECVARSNRISSKEVANLIPQIRDKLAQSIGGP